MISAPTVRWQNLRACVNAFVPAWAGIKPNAHAHVLAMMKFLFNHFQHRLQGCGSMEICVQSCRSAACFCRDWKHNLNCHFGSIFKICILHWMVCGARCWCVPLCAVECALLHWRVATILQKCTLWEQKKCIISLFIKGFTFQQNQKIAAGHSNCLNGIYANLTAAIFCFSVSVFSLNFTWKNAVVVIFIARFLPIWQKRFESQA